MESMLWVLYCKHFHQLQVDQITFLSSFDSELPVAWEKCCSLKIGACCSVIKISIIFNCLCVLEFRLHLHKLTPEKKKIICTTSTTKSLAVVIFKVSLSILWSWQWPLTFGCSYMCKCPVCENWLQLHVLSVQCVRTGCSYTCKCPVCENWLQLHV